MATISSAGIGSGLDVNNIVTQLVAIEKQPLKSLELKATNVKAQISAFGQIQSEFSTLSDVTTAISSSSSWIARTASSSNTSAATIAVTSEANATSFTVDVDALAQKQKTSFAPLPAGKPVGAGTLTFNIGSWNDLPAAQSALAAAQTALDNLNPSVADRNTALSDATAALATKNADFTTANGALTAANNAMAPFTQAYDAANAALTSANGAFAQATNAQALAQTTFDAADLAFGVADTKSTADAALSAAANLTRDDALTTDSDAASALAAFAVATPVAKGYSDAYTAWVGAVAANDHLTPSLQAAEDAALSAKNIAYGALGLVGSAAALAADSARDAALTADSNSAGALAAYASITPVAKDYSDAYTAWVAAVAANDHVTPGLQTAETTALTAKNTAYSTLAGVSPSVATTANSITAVADATDASALKLAAMGPDAVFAASKAAQVAANALTASADATDSSALKAAALTAAKTASASASAAAAALVRKSTTADELQTASNALTALQAPNNPREIAAAAVLQASDNLVVPTQTRDAAAAIVSQAAAAVATATSNHDAAVAAVAVATNAAKGVADATKALADAQSGVVSASPSFAQASSGATFEVKVTASDTVATLAAKINTANAGVVATTFFDGTGERLLLSSRETGTSAGFQVQVSDADGVTNDNAGLSRLDVATATTTYGQDARARINGLAVTSKTNTLTGNVPGVTINLVATTTTGYGTSNEQKVPVTMTVSEDVTVAVKNVQKFVDAYNKLSADLADLTKYDASTKTASLFQGDSSVLGLQSILRSMVGSISSGSSAYKRLSDVGLALQRDGSLMLDTSKLSAAANNGTELLKMFTTDNKNALSNGFALKFRDLSHGVMATGGSVVNKATALQSSLARNANEQTKVNDRAASFEARLRKQYSALDARMASLTALNAYVAQQVTTWNKSTG